MENEKIAIIAPANIKYVPYIKNYYDILKSLNQPYYTISWDKAEIEEDVEFSLHYTVADENRKKMLLGYFRFAKKCREIIKKNKTQKIIILTAAPAFFLGMRFLRMHTYILDIRDDSPLIRVAKKVFSKICNYAETIVVSSPNFRPWVSKEAILCHNADMTLVQVCQQLPIIRTDKEPYAIVFAGMMNEATQNLHFLKELEGDLRFSHIYYGRTNPEKEKIIKYVKDSKIKNVCFYGTYNKEEIVDIYRKNANFVNIIREKNEVNRNALPNKLYDAVFSGVPVLVYNHNEAISYYVKKYYLGIVLEEQIDNLGDYLYQAIAQFDYIKYAKGRNNFMNDIKNDMQHFFDALETFCR